MFIALRCGKCKSAVDMVQCSTQDFLVDAMAEPRSLEEVGEEWGFDGRGMHAHEGILRRAEWIRRCVAGARCLMIYVTVVLS